MERKRLSKLATITETSKFMAKMSCFNFTRKMHPERIGFAARLHLKLRLQVSVDTGVVTPPGVYNAVCLIDFSDFPVLERLCLLYKATKYDC